jgi:hypothetical protein
MAIDGEASVYSEYNESTTGESNVNRAGAVPTSEEIVSVLAAGAPVPSPAASVSAVSLVHERVKHSACDDGYRITSEGVRSTPAKFTPPNVKIVPDVVAPLVGAVAERTGASNVKVSCLVPTRVATVVDKE